MISAQLESIQGCWPELLQIFPTHHRELALFRDRMPLAPQTGEYFAREAAGNMFMATVRWNGHLVGYFICNVAYGFHYGETLTGTTDIYYIVPEARERGLFLPLYRCVERELKRRGVQVFYCGFKLGNPLKMDQMLPKLGFILADFYGAKWIGDASSSDNR